MDSQDAPLSHLNDEQRAAVLALHGPVLVVAGAGTGKTRTITHRIAMLIREGVAPSAILAVTFTNKAAREMRERVERLVGRGGVRVGTFHGFCASFLREEFPVIGRSGDFSIYDEGDSLALMKKVVEELKLDPAQTRPVDLRRAVGRWKDRFMTPAEAAQASTFGQHAIEARAYALYDANLVAANACDFDDLMIQALRLLLDHEVVRLRWQKRISHVLVDEFQDTNPIQYALVRTLSAPGGNLCVTGDQDQSIYSWRGADPGNFDNFLNDYPSARIVKLERNYRSSANILGAASRLIAHNKRRIAKTLRTQAPAGEAVRVVVFNDDSEEAAAVADAAQTAIREGAQPDEIAVFYRTNSLSLPVERALLARGVRYRVVGGLEFFARAEVKDLIAWLRWMSNRQDTVSFERIMNTPPRGLGDAAVERLEAIAAERGVSLPVLCADATAFGSLPERTRKAALAFCKLIHQLETELQAGRGVRAFAEELLELTAYSAWWATKASKAGSLDPFGNIGQFLTLAGEYDGTRGGRLADFLAEISLLTDLDRTVDDGPAVNLMTLHTSKGLEFDQVYIVGVDQSILPHVWAELEDRDDEEERRLLHVGMTRARQRLVLCAAQLRSRFGQTTVTGPSALLDELGRDGVERFGDESPRRDPRPFKQRWRDNSGDDNWASDASQCDDGEDHPLAALREGSRVFHQDFGAGEVLTVRGHQMGLERKVVVLFDGNQRRTLILRHSGLTLLDT
ncbi:MAG: hypothetical protein EXS14_10245 [Planctomycetes bacterium]|nr:hypothetical protein [Planctomycetota bacterium]